MDTTNQPDALLPAALLAEVEALAAAEHRSARDLLREAVEQFVQDRRSHNGLNTDRRVTLRRTPREAAAARMLDRRQFHPLPEGASIRDLMTFGRA